MPPLDRETVGTAISYDELESSASVRSGGEPALGRNADVVGSQNLQQKRTWYDARLASKRVG